MDRGREAAGGGGVGSRERERGGGALLYSVGGRTLFSCCVCFCRVPLMAGRSERTYLLR